MNLTEAEAVAARLVDLAYPARTYPNPARPGTHRVLVSGGRRQYWITATNQLPKAIADLEAGILTDRLASEGDENERPAGEVPVPRVPD